VNQIIPLGSEGGGNLVLCEVLRIHINETVLENGAIDQHKIDLVSRLGELVFTIKSRFV
jgi:flavin reductase (DIM6/NTAB) family NADH-FMN oxidoreductase RutF